MNARTILLEALVSNGIGDRPIAIIAHSLGGILAKEMLRIANECSDDDWRAIAEKTRLVVFLATPHTGAALASTVKLIAPRLASTHVDLLTNETGYLTSLNQSYRDLAHRRAMATISYYEKYKTKDAVLVVPRESADPGVGRSRPIGVDADHASICKPQSREALIFTSICRHIRAVLQECQSSTPVDGDSSFFGPEDYSTASESDRRDLLQKLIDAGREHEYQHANNLQNKFAQRYYKLGLYTDARCQADAILSGVEQRFITLFTQTKSAKARVTMRLRALYRNMS